MSALERFRASMVLDQEKWRDGIGYDLDVIRGATPEERAAIEALLLSRGVSGWRDVEALALLDTPRAREALREAAARGSAEVRVAVARDAPGVLAEAERTAALVHALRHGRLGDGLSQAIDEAATFHPPAVVEALLEGAARGDGQRAVHFAALLLHVHGQAPEPFDWGQRPFFLRFAAEDPAERAAAFRELCARIGQEAGRWLAG